MPLITIKRSTQLYRAAGPAGFFVAKPRREGTKLTASKLAEARGRIEAGQTLAEVSGRTGVLIDTLRKAIAAGRLPALKRTRTGSGADEGGPEGARRRKPDRRTLGALRRSAWRSWPPRPPAPASAR